MYPPDASPKAVSGRTSYYVTRLAFHSLPQVIPEYCTAHGFGPPLRFRESSSCSWQARHASGLTCIVIVALLRLAFAVPPRRSRLDNNTCKLVGSFCKKHAVTPCGAPTLCKQMVSGSISPGSSPYFSPFPHGTGSLLVILNI